LPFSFTPGPDGIPWHGARHGHRGRGHFFRLFHAGWRYSKTSRGIPGLETRGHWQAHREAACSGDRPGRHGPCNGFGTRRLVVTERGERGQNGTVSARALGGKRDANPAETRQQAIDPVAQMMHTGHPGRAAKSLTLRLLAMQ
jgi:hypothetical protein